MEDPPTEYTRRTYSETLSTKGGASKVVNHGKFGHPSTEGDEGKDLQEKSGACHSCYQHCCIISFPHKDATSHYRGCERPAAVEDQKKRIGSLRITMKRSMHNN